MYNFTTKPSYLHYLKNYNDIILHIQTKLKKKLQPTTTVTETLF